MFEIFLGMQEFLKPTRSCVIPLFSLFHSQAFLVRLCTKSFKSRARKGEKEIIKETILA
jgi:hypothetical protein